MASSDQFLTTTKQIYLLFGVGWVGGGAVLFCAFVCLLFVVVYGGVGGCYNSIGGRGGGICLGHFCFPLVFLTMPDSHFHSRPCCIESGR